MKTAGNILAALFDNKFEETAQGYSKLFNSWKDITEKNGIAAAADHSRIKELNNGILLIEMDHPGWKQILQTKQAKLLNDFRYRFPKMEISGISLMLARPGERELPVTAEKADIDIEPVVAEKTEKPEKPILEEALKGIDAIKDEEFKNLLIKLGKTIAENE